MELETPPPPAKKKRSLPGMPDPGAEVIALSPTTLMATNRFVCEICNKGFQRDQNLQLHRRGHNLPWKLRQRKEAARKRVYVCPEAGCVHHDPARALGDLTGIKKHFCRKHGEKKWKCERCSKRYAVQSDWKAHSKTCGSREYRCDCGTLFSRRDSFITHRAFCDALAEESARARAAEKEADGGGDEAEAALPVSAMPPEQLQEEDYPVELPHYAPSAATAASNNTSNSGGSSGSAATATTTAVGDIGTGVDALSAAGLYLPTVARADYGDLSLVGGSAISSEGKPPPSVFPLRFTPPVHALPRPPPPPAHISATALLQKASQMGSSMSCSSALKSLAGMDMFDSLEAIHDGGLHHWGGHPGDASSGLLPYDAGAMALPELMMGNYKPTATLDLLGLGMPCPDGDAGFPAMMPPQLGIPASGGATSMIGRAPELEPWGARGGGSPAML